MACLDEDLRAGVTHQDFAPTDMLSVVASLTPYSDFNQSPRNMYQCQMGKQTMGTPMSNYRSRSDNKIYRIQTPQVRAPFLSLRVWCHEVRCMSQAPLVRTRNHIKYEIDDFPLGTNAVIAVISYTGGRGSREQRAFTLISSLLSLSLLGRLRYGRCNDYQQAILRAWLRTRYRLQGA